MLNSIHKKIPITSSHVSNHINQTLNLLYAALTPTGAPPPADPPAATALQEPVQFFKQQTWQSPNTSIFLFLSSSSSPSSLHLHRHLHHDCPISPPPDGPHASWASSQPLHHQNNLNHRNDNNSNHKSDTKPDISLSVLTISASRIPRGSNSGTSSTLSTGWAHSDWAPSSSTAATKVTSNGSPKTPASSGKSPPNLAL